MEGKKLKNNSRCCKLYFPSLFSSNRCLWGGVKGGEDKQTNIANTLTNTDYFRGQLLFSVGGWRGWEFPVVFFFFPDDFSTPKSSSFLSSQHYYFHNSMNSGERHSINSKSDSFLYCRHLFNICLAGYAGVYKHLFSCFWCCSYRQILCADNSNKWTEWK